MMDPLTREVLVCAEEAEAKSRQIIRDAQELLRRARLRATGRKQRLREFEEALSFKYVTRRDNHIGRQLSVVARTAPLAPAPASTNGLD
jgi:hypothetical protein